MIHILEPLRPGKCHPHVHGHQAACRSKPLPSVRTSCLPEVASSHHPCKPPLIASRLRWRTLSWVLTVAYNRHRLHSAGQCKPPAILNAGLLTRLHAAADAGQASCTPSIAPVRRRLENPHHGVGPLDSRSSTTLPPEGIILQLPIEQWLTHVRSAIHPVHQPYTDKCHMFSNVDRLGPLWAPHLHIAPRDLGSNSVCQGRAFHHCEISVKAAWAVKYVYYMTP